MREVRANRRRLVVHVVPSLDFGGVEKHMEILAKYSHHSRMDHVFVAIGAGGYAEKAIRENGCEVCCLNASVKIPSLRSMIMLFQYFRNNAPDVVHMHNVSASFHGLFAAQAQGVPVKIAEVVGAGQHSCKARLVFRWVYLMADRVLGVSEATSNNLIKMGEIPKEKSVTLYNPVELRDRVGFKNSSQDKFRICSVGRLEEVKNYDSLIWAVDLLCQKGIKCELWLVGDGSQRNALEELVASRSLREVVRFFGYQREPTGFVKQCHVYVQPSHAEAFGIALVEAMGVSVPVIATSVGGAPEIVQNGETGWLLPEETPEAIASALETAWEYGPGRLWIMGQSAKKSVHNRFDPVMYIEKLEEIYLAELHSKGL